MIFPFKKRTTFQDPFDPAFQIDREVCDRARRLIIGINLESDFRYITGSLIVVEGKGKYLKLVKTSTCSEAVPLATRQFLRTWYDASEPNLADLKAIQSDLCQLQQSMVEQLKNHAGKYIDRLLIISLSDPGLRMEDKESNSYVPICDPAQLADSTGISVVDAFPTRDINSGGMGIGLNALPAWIGFADRSPKIARKNRLVMILNEQIELIYIPASDGLDVELPNIQFERVPGISLLTRLTGESSLHEIAQANVIGRYHKKIASAVFAEDWEVSSKSYDFPDLVRSTVVAMVENCSEKIRELTSGQILDEIILDCPEPLIGTFINQLDRDIEKTRVIFDLPIQGQPGHLSSILVALLGAMSIDQMPGNIPWISGADCQKILGRFSPGSAANWRQLLREMSDFQPPAMRLRDAI